MVTFGDLINRKLLEGSLPTYTLYPSIPEAAHQIDFEKESIKAFEFLKENPDFFYFYFVASNDRIHEMESAGIQWMYTQEVNVLVNTGFPSSAISIMSEPYRKAIELTPAITNLDKRLWYAAFTFYFSAKYVLTEDIAENIEMSYAWIYLLHLVQEKELTYGVTINGDEFEPLTDFLDIILSPWTKDSDILSPLSSIELDKLRYLKGQRKELVCNFNAEIDKSLCIANETSGQWDTYLTLINDLSKRELEAITQINRSGTKRDKLSAINDYNYLLLEISKGRYTLDGKELKLIPVFDEIERRYTNALVFCKAHADNTESFFVSPSAFIILMNPSLTFNYLLLSFHLFRMQINKENADRFFRLALSCLRRNLSVRNTDISEIESNTEEWVAIEKEIAAITSLDGIVSAFFDTADSFYQSKKHSIDSLSFESLQSDSSYVLSSTGTGLESEEVSAEWKNHFLSIDEKTLDNAFDAVFGGRNKPSNPEDVLKQTKSLDDFSQQEEEKTIARQIVVSLNVIYMVCEALRIVLVDSRDKVKVKDKAKLSEYRNKLLKLDDVLVHRVYSHISDKEMGMLEYREKKGINPVSLSDQESEAEYLRNSTFADILKRSIDSLTEHLNDDSNEKLLEVKSKIKAAILHFPDCDEKDQYAEWLDSISEKINSHLINNCQKDSQKYSDKKQVIIKSLGSKSIKLPDSSIDSLTTAEILYDEYVVEEYAEMGFDYSCVSALYYQAFENAYNALIWQGYASLLNNLNVDGTDYTEILRLRKNLNGMGPFSNADGYLPNSGNSRGHYVSYGNPQYNTVTEVKDRCMYKSFGLLMEHVKQRSDLPKLCEYFASIAGFDQVGNMLSDQAFMQIIADFAAAIVRSADDRNNASHGGSIITISQCMADKKTIINALEEIRRTSIGLIQQLLFLLYSHE